MLEEQKNIENTDEKTNNEVSDTKETTENSKPKAETKRRKRKTAAASSESGESAAESGESDKDGAADNVIDAPSLYSLLVEDDEPSSPQNNESSSGFEEFLADYKNVIKNTLSKAKGALAKDEDTEEITEAEEEQGAVIIEDENTPQFALDIGVEVSPHESDVTFDPDESKNTYNPEKPRFIDNVFDFLELFVFTLAAVLIITSFFFKHTIVDGPSMQNTLQDGEHLIISDLFYTPKRGDIIVFSDYSASQKDPFVKRIIAVAGDKVTVDENGQVTVNGKKLNEDYVFIDGNIPYSGKTLVVPEGEVFVLGDHRNNSYDSAQFPHGTIKVESILGKVLFRIFPFDKIGTVD